MNLFCFFYTIHTIDPLTLQIVGIEGQINNGSGLVGTLQ